MAEHVFTDDEIRQIIDVINRTKHTKYIGARYVPIFGRKGETSIAWDPTAPYEPLTIVLHRGDSYTSRQFVPAGIDVHDERYWANTGNYSAQIEQYRQDVAQYDARITAAQAGADAANDKLAAMGVHTDSDGADLLNRIGDIDTRANTNTSIFNAMGIDNAIDAAPYEKLTPNITKLTNVVEKGVDNTGANDVSDLLNNIAKNSQYGVYFPAGVYKITKTINFPRQTKWAYSVTLEQGATIIADEPMGVMFSLGAFPRGDGNISEGFSLTGGQFNGKDNAGVCIKTSPEIRQSIISNVDVRYFNDTGIYIGANVGESTDTIVSNVRIGRVQSPHHKPNTRGIYFEGNDNQLNCAYICDNEKNIEANGFVQLSNIHIFNDKTWYDNEIKTSGIIAWAGLSATNIYLDSIDYPITCANKCIVSNVYFYNYYSSDYERPYFRVQNGRLTARNIGVGGVQCDNDIILQIVDFADKNISINRDNTCSFDIDTYLHINEKGINDRYNYVYGNKSAKELRVNTEKYGTFPANTGFIVGYIGTDNNNNSSVIKFDTWSSNGYDFSGSGIITYYKNATPQNRAKITSFKMDEWCSENFGLALGVAETVNIHGTNTQLIPIYIYTKKQTTRIPETNIKPYFTFGKGGYSYFSSQDSTVQLTTENTIATLNNGGAL